MKAQVASTEAISRTAQWCGSDASRIGTVKKAVFAATLALFLSAVGPKARAEGPPPCKEEKQSLQAYIDLSNKGGCLEKVFTFTNFSYKQGDKGLGANKIMVQPRADQKSVDPTFAFFGPWLPGDGKGEEIQYSGDSKGKALIQAVSFLLDANDGPGQLDVTAEAIICPNTTTFADNCAGKKNVKVKLEKKDCDKRTNDCHNQDTVFLDNPVATLAVRATRIDVKAGRLDWFLVLFGTKGK
jgi:hypothetical protein